MAHISKLCLVLLLSPALTRCVCVCVGVYSAFLGQGAGAAQSPKASRLVEAILLELCQLQHHERSTIAGVRIRRWGVVMADYGRIRDIVLTNPTLKAGAHIQLYDKNK